MIQRRSTPGHLALAALASLATVAAHAATPNREPFYQFRFVEFPRMVRQLDRSIRLAEAEAAVWNARVESYRPFRSFNQYSPTYTAEQSARLHLLSIEQRLDELQEKRARLNRYRRAVIAELKRDASFKDVNSVPE